MVCSGSQLRRGHGLPAAPDAPHRAAPVHNGTNAAQPRAERAEDVPDLGHGCWEQAEPTGWLVPAGDRSWQRDKPCEGTLSRDRGAARAPGTTTLRSQPAPQHLYQGPEEH